MQRNLRMKRETRQLQEGTSNGISCCLVEDRTDRFQASIIGEDNTPYEGGIFKLDIAVPERYPFEPPQIHFLTPIYHPNIDSAGRICLDILKMPPKGAWKPVHNISIVLKSIQILMAFPNPEDPLMPDIATELKQNKSRYVENAKKWTRMHAADNQTCKAIEDKNVLNTNPENQQTQGKRMLAKEASPGHLAKKTKS